MCLFLAIIFQELTKTDKNKPETVKNRQEETNIDKNYKQSNEKYLLKTDRHQKKWF